MSNVNDQERRKFCLAAAMDARLPSIKTSAGLVQAAAEFESYIKDGAKSDD